MICLAHPLVLMMAAASVVLMSCSGSGSGGIADCMGADDYSPVVRKDSRPNIIFIFTDDQGYSDIGANNAVSDISTPNIDMLAKSGVRMTDGYVTAPQCTPSRAALMSGVYQQKFGVDDNKYSPFPLEQPMLAERLAAAGYVTGQVGKWHLDVNKYSSHWYSNYYAPGSTETFDLSSVPEEEKRKYYPDARGFKEFFTGPMYEYRANFERCGELFEPKTFIDSGFRVDIVSDAAVSFIKRHKREPFFLYVAYFAPHAPLEAPEKYLERFPGDMPERRRYALAMMSAVDDGVGRIMAALEGYGIDEDTIVFFISDNGAPLDLVMDDVLPVSATSSQIWDGSLNYPWVGEKGMLTEGAIRVPFVVRWKSHLPEGLVYREPVIALDATATAASVAGIDAADMDGVNLIPYLSDNSKAERSLYWRFWNQAAIRKGKWKYIRLADEKEYLFDLSSEQHETANLLHGYPDVAAELYQELGLWTQSLKYPGLPGGTSRSDEREWYQYHMQ